MEKSKPQEIVEALSESILSGELPPGSKLTETELARKLDVNRAPLREALFRLEERQLIERTPYSGMRVAMVSKDVLRELYEIRELLEGRAARRAAELATPNDIADLKNIVTTSSKAVAKLATRGSVDARKLPAVRDFHTEIAQIAANKEIQRMLSREIWQFIRVAHQRWNRSQERLVIAAQEHVNIYEAIAAKDAELAEILMIRHIRTARDGLMPTD